MMQNTTNQVLNKWKSFFEEFSKRKCYSWLHRQERTIFFFRKKWKIKKDFFFLQKFNLISRSCVIDTLLNISPKNVNLILIKKSLKYFFVCLTKKIIHLNTFWQPLLGNIFDYFKYKWNKLRGFLTSCHLLK